MTRALRRLADSGRPGSMADRFRQRRFVQLRRLVDALPRPVRILDVGGTPGFWERVGYAGRDDIEIVLVNLMEQESTHANITATIGDAIDLSTIGNGRFDVVVSNSVIEHLPSLALQARMASEVQRVAKRLYLQTPNRYFPLEPHFLFPFFAMLPVGVRAFLLQRANLGWYKREPDLQRATEVVRSVRLMTGSELRRLFPGATFENERFFLLTKSFVVLDGWDPPEA